MLLCILTLSQQGKQSFLVAKESNSEYEAIRRQKVHGGTFLLRIVARSEGY